MELIHQRNFVKKTWILIIVFISSFLMTSSLKFTNAFYFKPPEPAAPDQNDGNEDQISNDSDSENQTLNNENMANQNNDPEGESIHKDPDHIEEDTKVEEDIKDLPDNNDGDENIDNKTEKKTETGNEDLAEDNQPVETTIDNDEIKDENPPDYDESKDIPAAKVIRGSSYKNIKRVALTFDDGPDTRFTPQVLDIIKEYNLKATFFVLGSAAHENRNILDRIHREGHVIGSHSWSHSNFKNISNSKIISELKKTNGIIEEVTGKTNSLFRLPFGAYDDRVLKTVAGQGFYNIYWSIDPRDWSGNSPKEILDNIEQNIEPGAIILLHSAGSKQTIPNSIEALPQIIEFLDREGYEVVTVPELLGIPHPTNN